MKHLYGPVKSRRLGLSLGLSLTPYKVCSFDCIYCQLQTASIKTSERREYIDIREVIEELRSWLENNPGQAKTLSYITISGSGEPTLNIKIGELISQIKKLTTVPLAVITNASLLSDPLVRRDIREADLIVPSLDAATDAVFARIDRPFPTVKIEDIIRGLEALRQEYRGKIWLEVMLVSGVNDDLRHIKRIKEAAERINPDKIQLNSPVRSSAQLKLRMVPEAKLRKIKSLLGENCEII
ncbi:MAG: radical SAM protein [Candidatus Omnitrophota bacterium]